MDRFRGQWLKLFRGRMIPRARRQGGASRHQRMVRSQANVMESALCE